MVGVLFVVLLVIVILLWLSHIDTHVQTRADACEHERVQRGAIRLPPLDLQGNSRSGMVYLNKTPMQVVPEYDYIYAWFLSGYKKAVFTYIAMVAP